MSYQCPLCHQTLHPQARSWCCDNNHQFDQAKEGYVNLLPVHHKGSKNPGDSTEMMQARRLFLNANHYNPMRQRVLEQLRQYLPKNSALLLDIGCGEGYYTSTFTQLQDQHAELNIHGLDIAKVAVRYAAKRYPDCHFCVASSHRLPFDNQSIDAIVRIYAPCKAEELKRTVKPGGIVVTVSPAPRHLYQLKALIYKEVHLHDENTETLDGFELINDQQLHYDMTLNGQEASALMQMTPFAWKTPHEVWQQLAKAHDFHCEADFSIRVHRRCDDNAA